MTLLWGENTRFSRPFGDKRAELGRQLVANEILASLRWQASRARATARASRDSCVPSVASEQSSSDGSCPTRLRLVILMLLMMFVGVGDVWGQTGPVEITTDADASGTIEDSEKKLYLIQTNGFQSFYIAPQANNTITTNNILGDYMLWYFLDAGEDGGTQYYYIVNNSTGQYICHGGGTDGSDAKRAVTLVEKDASNDERCKFYIAVDNSNGTTGFYNIDAKGKPSYYGLNKRNGSQSNTYPIRLTNDAYIHDFNSKWKFIRFNGSFTWPDPPFTPSTDSDQHYYEIQNYQKQTYYASTDETPDKVTFTNVETTDRKAWYFKEASSDSWFKYYYIINPATGGKYMYYSGTATNGKDQTNAVSVKAYDSNNEDRYLFVVVQAARGDMDKGVDQRKTCYAIIPKLLLGNLWSSNSLGLAEGSISDGAKMGIISSRGATNSAQWDIKPIVFSTVCGDPVISFSNTTGKATITTTTSWSNIYYTTDGTTPSSTNGTLYNGPFDVTEETTIKAIATKEGFTNSGVTTTTIYKVATPTIQQETGTHNISITTTTPGATIYYTIDGTTNPTTSSTLYTGPSEELGGKPIKAIAVKDGMINSDIGEGTISIKCATPVISFNNATSMVSITCNTEGSTIHYTTDGSTPTASSTEYAPFSVTSPTTVKAIATHATLDNSSVAELAITQVATPTIQNNGSNAVSITCATEGATIYYTTDGSTPTTGSTLYTTPLTENVSGVTIKAIAVMENMIPSEIGSGSVTLQCAAPVITRDGMTFTISCSMPIDATFYYSLDGSTPTTLYSGPVSFTLDVLPMTVTAVAKHANYNDSDPVIMTLKNGEGTVSDPYLIFSATDFTNFISDVNAGTSSSAYYKLETDVSANGVDAITTAFSGTFDGGMHTISNLTHALFNTIDGGTVKNVKLSGVNITSGTNVGAICNEADGTSKIYNCGILSGTVSSSSSGSNVGGLVGHIKSGSSVRVVNCYNYGDVSGKEYAAGIVGWNEGTVGDVRIALCMMYGNVSGATHVSPVYGGNHVSNSQNFTEYNFYLYSNERDDNGDRIIKVPYTSGDYNDQLAIDKEEYLTRFPFYRHILNTHRELGCYFLFGDYSADHVNEIGHWAVKKGDDVHKYPIVEPWVKNRTSTPTETNNNVPNTTEDYAGKLLTSMGNSGYLSVSIKIGSNSYSASLPITDMDTLRYDYNYGKVILPFANEYEINTDYSQICTGWKITKVGSSMSSSVTNYNFADRDNLQKDIYNEATNPFIYAQGGYYIVPTGVTEIEITANFATAYYLSDATYEIGYKSDYTGRTGLGGNVSSFHDKTVYNSLTDAVNALTITTTNPHKQAIVLVGNYHYDLANTALATTKGFTLMSIDADNNQEPDYGFYSIASDRPRTPALRFDFVPIISLGMAAKVNGSDYYPGVPIWKSRGWYEQTETTLSIMNQFELDSGNFTLDETNADNLGKGKNPCIINGGYFVQMIRSNSQTNCNKVSYFKIGGNAYIKEFYPGAHSNKPNNLTTIVPINVTGGQVDECFMTGYKSGAKAIGSDIRFWCSGGKIGKFLGAYMDEPWATEDAKGNVNMTAKVDHALIGRFFGGGTSQSAAITGDITVTINNSKVDFYCGGPEFGNMSAGKVVNTTANNTRFGEYYGAGFGGTAITYSPKDGTPAIGQSVSFSGYTYNSNRLKTSGNLGFATCYKFEFLMHSANKQQLVARFITGYANFNLATTGNVTNNLTGCTIEKDFYGAGCQGKVDGTVNSTLTNCTLMGSAFGGGYKATSNDVNVYPASAPTLSVYNGETGIFSEFGTTEPAIFTWEQGTSAKQNTYDDCDSNGEGGKLYTSKDIIMSDLGNVTGAISITIDGGYVGGTSQGQTPAQPATSTSAAIPAGGNVYGGGNESKSLSNTTVNLKGNAKIYGSVFGGGNKAEVNGNATVNIEE